MLLEREKEIGLSCITPISVLRCWPVSVNEGDRQEGEYAQLQSFGEKVIIREHINNKDVACPARSYAHFKSSNVTVQTNTG